MFRIFLLFTVFGTTINFLYAQKLETMGIETPWSKGKIIIDDGRELTGLIKLNELQGKISYKKDDLDDTNSFSRSEVIFLVYFDREANLTRKFYRYSFGREETGGEEATYLCEVIREFPTFQILSAKTPLIVTMVSTGSKVPNNGTPVLSQNEYLLFCRYDSIPEMYLGIARGNSTKDEVYLTKSGKIFNKKIPERYFSQQWPLIRKYIKDKNINFRSRNGLMTVLDYYATLLPPK